MKVSTRSEQSIETRSALSYFLHYDRKPLIYRFDEVTEKILLLGGRITTQISEPKLTHVVLDQDDLSRRVELMRLTEQ